LGDLLERGRFAGPALFLGVAFLLFDTITSERKAPEDEHGLVVDRPSHLHAHVTDVFRQRSVAIDFAGYMGQTFHELVDEFLDDVRSGRSEARSIRLRMLIPDFSLPMTVPCQKENLQDHPEFRANRQRASLDSCRRLREKIDDINKKQLASEAQIEVRVHRLTPVFKLYLLNGRYAFVGFYPVEEASFISTKGHDVLFDLKGTRTALVGARHDGRAWERALFSNACEWFEAAWSNLSYPPTIQP
jgi:hypothetical protein